MKSIIIFFIISLACVLLIFGQITPSPPLNDIDHMYMVMSTSNDLHTHNIKPPHTSLETFKDTGFISLLLTLRDDSIKVVDTLNFDQDKNTYIKYISKSIHGNWISMVERDILDMEDRTTYCTNNYISAIDYSEDTIVIRQMKIPCDIPRRYGGIVYSYAYFLDNEYYLPIHFVMGTRLHYVMNRHFDIRLVTEDQFFDDWVVNLEPGLQIRGYNYFRFNRGGYIYFFMEGGNKLAKSVLTGRTKECRLGALDFPFRPKNYENIKGVRILYREVNSQYLIASYAYNQLEPLPLDQRLYFIKDNVNEVWDTISLPINNNFSVYQDEWAYGTLIRQCPDCQYDDALDSFNVYMEKYPDKYSQKYGYYPNLTLASGRLFLFHIPTKQYFEFDTGERDSEFLAIHRNEIFYRKYDEIKKMSLNLENGGFDTSTITTLVKENDLIPNIHYIFWTSATEFRKDILDFNSEYDINSFKE